MSEIEAYRGAVLLLIGTATAIFGWLHARRTGLAQAEHRLAGVQRRLMAAHRQREREERRMTALRLDDLEARLRACEKRWQKWSGGPIG
jgi:hypothetical protein